MPVNISLDYVCSSKKFIATLKSSIMLLPAINFGARESEVRERIDSSVTLSVEFSTVARPRGP